MKKNIRKIKNNKGAISTLTLITILVFLAVLSVGLFTVTALRKSQLQSDLRIQEVYGKDVNNVNEIYNEVYNDLVDKTRITLNKTTTSIEIGETEQLVATITSPYLENRNVTWTSSNTSIATVSNGVVTAVSKGSATITARMDDQIGKSVTCHISVVEPSSSVNQINN